MYNSSVYFTTFLKIDSNAIKMIFDEFLMSRRKKKTFFSGDFTHVIWMKRHNNLRCEKSQKS